MKIKLILGALVVFVVLTTSCNFQKRLYRDGFYVAGNNKKSCSTEERSVAAIALSEQALPELVSEVLPAEHATPAMEGPSVRDIQTEVKKTESLIVPDVPGSMGTIHSTPVTKAEEPQQLKKEKSQQGAAPQPAGDKSQLVALLLCIFLGMIGAHRFYLGYIGIGVLMLFTLGVFGILWLIDLIRLITGSLQPKNGSYTDSL